MTKTEKAHIQWIKSQPCGLCQAPPPSDAHHIIQGRLSQRKTGHFTTIPLCKVCHQDQKQGIHGERLAWKFRKTDELDILNETIKRIVNG